MLKKNVGNILKLFISKKDYKERLPKDEIELGFGGVVDDKFYDKDINRSVLLATTDSYELTKQNKIDIDYGTLGENILMDFNPYNLDIGTKLQISEVVLEISQRCPICNHLSSIKQNLPKLLKKDRGIFAKVISNGTIKIGDSIIIID